MGKNIVRAWPLLGRFLVLRILLRSGYQCDIIKLHQSLQPYVKIHDVINDYTLKLHKCHH